METVGTHVAVDVWCSMSIDSMMNIDQSVDLLIYSLTVSFSNDNWAYIRFFTSHGTSKFP